LHRHVSEVPTGSRIVCLSAQSGSEWHIANLTRMTQMYRTLGLIKSKVDYAAFQLAARSQSARLWALNGVFNWGHEADVAFAIVHICFVKAIGCTKSDGLLLSFRLFWC
jgi:hypothetical protein